MSHLRPVHADTGLPKAVRDYSKEERESAIIQIEDAARVRPASADTVALAERMRRGKGDDDVCLGGRQLDIETTAREPVAANGTKKQ